MRRGSKASPSEQEPDWADGNDADAESTAYRTRSSSSSHGGQQKERRTSMPHAPPVEEDSFYEEEDPLKPENVLGHWHFAPLLIAVLPPVGAVLGGHADAWSDAILLILASFWLYQFLRVPHDMYHAARTRRILRADADERDEAEGAVNEESDPARQQEFSRRRRERQEATLELQRAEMLSLIFLVLSPLAGAWLLTWMMDAFTDGNRYLNRFNIRLFMLASGIKPWSHAISLFRQRLLHLQEVVHYPSSRVEALNRRIGRLESDLSTLRKLVATKSDVSLLRDGIDVPLTQLSRNMRKYEKKEEHLRLSAEDKFSLVESRLEDLLREVAINAELIEEERRERQKAISLPASIFQALRFALGQRSYDQQYAYNADGQRVLPHSATLGITHTPDGGGAPSMMRTSTNGGTISASSSTSSTSESLPSHSSPPRQGLQPSGNHNALTVSSAAAKHSRTPAWTEEGFAYWVFLPINIPRSFMRSALSFANGRYSAAREVNYAQGYAALTAGAGPTNAQGVAHQPRNTRKSAVLNGKARSPSSSDDRIGGRTPLVGLSNSTSSVDGFSRRV